jgi:hypothetical protein
LTTGRKPLARKHRKEAQERQERAYKVRIQIQEALKITREQYVVYRRSKEFGQWNKSVFETGNSVFENIMLRRVSELDRQKVTGAWRSVTLRVMIM